MAWTSLLAYSLFVALWPYLFFRVLRQPRHPKALPLVSAALAFVLVFSAGAHSIWWTANNPSVGAFQ